MTLLRACRLFEDVPEEALRQVLLPQGKPQEFAEQTAIISPQGQVSWFGVILEGKVEISQIFSDGFSSLMETLEPPALLGLDLICTETRRAPYYAVAVSRVRLLRFSADVVLQPGFLPEACRLDVWRKLLLLLSRENLRKHYRLAILSQRGLRNRILTYLTMQTERLEVNSFQIPMSRAELADYLCVNRSALSHELSRMEQEGLILFRKNRFTLLEKGKERSTWASLQ